MKYLDILLDELTLQSKDLRNRKKAAKESGDQMEEMFITGKLDECLSVIIRIQEMQINELTKK